MKFTISESASLICYSIDGDANVEVFGETILPRLPNGEHSIVVFATDLAGNVGTSEIINFYVDLDTLNISLLSPQNQTYTYSDLLLNFTLNETASWIGYSLDGHENVTLTNNIRLKNLTYGSHMITVYANDTVGNMAASETVHFSVSEPFSIAWITASIFMVGSGIGLLLFFHRKNRETTSK